jgi:hypothetical protein
VLVLLPRQLRAQESDLVPREYAPTASETDESTYDATAFPAAENDKSLRSTGYTLKDSVGSKTSGSSRRAKKSSSENIKANTDSQRTLEKKEEKEKNESVLSFNFLYYIFQKFKMSDIVDR